jgi:predicted O-linked N-acetylglucosamine transferase (SPINDLY family)
MNEPAFASLLERAAEKRLNAIELMSAASEVEGYDRIKLLELYKVWIENNSEDPLLSAIYFNYGIVLGSAEMTAEACNAYIMAININKHLFPAYINLASAYEKLNRIDFAIQIHEEMLRLLSLLTLDNINYKSLSLVQLSRIQIAQNNTEAAEKCLLESLSIKSDQPDVLMHVVDQRLKQCKWPVFDIQSKAPRPDFVRNMAPLTVAAYSNDPLLHLGISNAYSNKTIKEASATIARKPATNGLLYKDKRLRIGYLSSDLYGHAIGSLMSDIFGLHDRTKIEVAAYYYGPDRSDHFQNRIRSDVDSWTNIGSMSDAEAAQRISDDGVDILVDVNGHSMSARTSILAFRPAPIMVNWLGFPGTMGSAYHHYILADDYIVPDGYDMFYSEKVMRLPCYQPNDRQRIVSDQPLARQDCGLKDEAFVFCCFNGCHKITEQIFMLWMEILKNVPDSQLWLLSDKEEVNNRLRERASRSGVAPERIVFAERKANHEHLKRYQLADLFLDTFPYGAHTTSSDSLWMGVPVVTLSGHGFASRVCGSLVRSAGLPELICNSPEEYSAKAIEIGSSRERSNELKNKLTQQKDSCVLFDMPLLVRSLDEIYRQMWHEYLDGNLPQPDLANLDEYLEVGMELDQKVDTFAPIAERMDAYRKRLVQRRRKRDSRLLGDNDSC